MGGIYILLRYFQPHPTQCCDQLCCCRLMDTSWRFWLSGTHKYILWFFFKSTIIIANQHDLMLISLIPASWIIQRPHSSYLRPKTHLALLFPIMMVWGSSSGRTTHLPQREGVLLFCFLLVVLTLWRGRNAAACSQAAQLVAGVCVCSS